MLNCLLISPKTDIHAKCVKEYLHREGDAKLVQCSSLRAFPHELLKTQAFDLIITFDLAGFDQTTLTDGVFFNLINSKFVNFILHENLENERFLAKQLSLSMFFYCAGQHYYERLLREYPDIPYLKPLENVESFEKSSDNQCIDAILRAIDEVMKECHML